jgi:hypothetical protein
MEELLLPRVVINIPGALEFRVIMTDRKSGQFDYNSTMQPEQERKTPGASIAGSFLVLSLCTGESIQGWELPFLRRSRSSSARHSQRFLVWAFSNPVLPLIGICVGNMVRRRGTPRRGAAWEANKAQRRREEELERALALASSILRKKARVEGRATLKSIVERETGSSKEQNVTEPVGWCSGCVVEEEPPAGDSTGMEKSNNGEMLTIQNNDSAPTMMDDIPGCLVEEIPWSEELMTDNQQAIDAEQLEELMTDDQQATEAEQLEEMMTGENAEQLATRRDDNGKGENGNGGGELQSPFLRSEHLALVFELRSHVADLEHRAVTMGQRLDVLLEELSGTPAPHRCHMGMQASDLWENADGRAKSSDA